ncbi:hypothetical protein MTO96_043952 [Rhipicephalus appendiculatus]
MRSRVHKPLKWTSRSCHPKIRPEKWTVWLWGERQDGHTWTEDGWHTVLTRRQKKSQTKKQKNASEAAECNTSSSSQPKQGIQVKRGRRTRRRPPPPPLPKEDIKIVLRPHKGLAAKDLLGYELSTAVINACHRHFDGGSLILRVHPGSNIIILSTPHEHVAEELREITHMTIRGRVHSFNSYVADPEDIPARHRPWYSYWDFSSRTHGKSPCANPGGED